MRWINRAGATLIVLAFMLGPPVATGVWIRAQGWSRPTPAQANQWLEQPLTPATFVALMVCITAVLWLLLVSFIIRRAWYASTARIRRLRRLPLPSAAQMTAGSMAGVAAMALPSVIVQHPGATVPSTVSHTDLVEPAVELGPADAVVAGVELPGGGWVPYRTALAVSALSAMIWLHRRQHYQPRDPRFGQHDQDLDLQPLPQTAQAITAATSKNESPPHLEAESMLLLDLPTGLVALHGPGAISAARGLLTTAILSSALSGAAPTSVVINQRGLELLLGATAADDLPAGLRIGDVDVALAGSPVRRGEPGGDSSPALMLTRQSGQPAGRNHDDGAADRDVEEVTVVVVGDHLMEGSRWEVAADGTIVGAGTARPGRLCTLDRRAAVDLLLLVQQRARSASPITAQAPPHPQQPVAELNLLGGCRLQVQGRTVHLRRSASLQILAYLAVHPDGATTTDLIRAIWPGLTPKTISKRLHTTLSDLRQQLHRLAPDLIIRRDERYLLNPDTIDTDVRQLRRMIRAAAGAVTLDEQRTAVQDVIGAYSGELGAGFSWPWLHPAREALRREVIDAYLHGAASAPAAQAVTLVRAAADVDPYNETLHHHGARILNAAGEHTAAESLLRAHQQRLVAAGLHPGASDAHPVAEKHSDLRL